MLSNDDIARYTEFINSVHYPPNPHQDRTREYRGDMSLPEAQVSPAGLGSRRGLRFFHTLATGSFAGRSCVQCHFLPEGSNNRLTFEGNPYSPAFGDTHNVDLYPFALKLQPIETAGLRGLDQKEIRLELTATVPSPAIPRLQTGDLGFGHEGHDGVSRNDFVDDIPDMADQHLTDIVQYMREFDSGIAPIVGKSLTLLPADLGGAPVGITDAGKQAFFGDLLAQAGLANCGVAVYGRFGSASTERGYWYRLDGTLTAPALFQEEGLASSASAQTLFTDVLANSSNVMIVTATPLGSERRYAALDGQATPLVGSAPSSMVFVDTKPNTANDDLVATPISANFDASSTPPFTWVGQIGGVASPSPLSLRALWRLRNALDPTVPRAHDVPRRLRVTGNNLVCGAQIRLTIPISGPLFGQPGGPAFPPTRTIELPIFPTTETAEGQIIWETAVELDPLTLYVLLLGGPRNPEVKKALRDVATAAPDPANGVYLLEARNDSGTWHSQGSQPLVY